jgi:hypothetical protein
MDQIIRNYAEAERKRKADSAGTYATHSRNDLTPIEYESMRKCSLTTMSIHYYTVMLL